MNAQAPLKQTEAPEEKTRCCIACGAPLVRRDDERAWHWEKRKTCGHSCGAKARKGRPRASLADRLWARVERGDATECWIWTGAKTRNGYGVIGRPGRGSGNALTHRVALELDLGEPIPPTREVDHLCRNRLCCNPAHLSLATRAENMRRGRRVVVTLRERDWQQQVVEVATLYGWRHFHALNMRGSDAGWPDLVLCRPPEILIVELKASKGRLTPAQREWLQVLSDCDVETAVWRPEDFDAVHVRLRARVPKHEREAA